MRSTTLVLSVFLGLASSNAFAADCPAYLEQDVRILRSKDSANLCERYLGQPVLIVNTASHCGFTPQFKDLEAVYQSYKDRGLRVAGFPSNDFRQEAASEEATAEICFVNYGVTFDMYNEVHVKGQDAHPLFKGLAAATNAPQWNFTKYLVDRNGKVVASFPSSTTPDSPAVREAIENVL